MNNEIFPWLKIQLKSIKSFVLLMSLARYVFVFVYLIFIWFLWNKPCWYLGKQVFFLYKPNWNPVNAVLVLCGIGICLLIFAEFLLRINAADLYMFYWMNSWIRFGETDCCRSQSQKFAIISMKKYRVIFYIWSLASIVCEKNFWRESRDWKYSIFLVQLCTFVYILVHICTNVYM